MSYECERIATETEVRLTQELIALGWRRCAAGQRTTQQCGLVEEARQVVDAWMQDGIEVLIRTERDKTDKYGRMLADVWGYGINLSDHLVGRGLARRYDGGKR